MTELTRILRKITRNLGEIWGDLKNILQIFEIRATGPVINWTLTPGTEHSRQRQD